MTAAQPVWIGTCPKCGPVRIAQIGQPSACANQIKFGKRSIRRCRETLTDVRSTRGEK